eukprot:679354-Rhodomonas_salina.1
MSMHDSLLAWLELTYYQPPSPYAVSGTALLLSLSGTDPKLAVLLPGKTRLTAPRHVSAPSLAVVAVGAEAAHRVPLRGLVPKLSLSLSFPVS